MTKMQQYKIGDVLKIKKGVVTPFKLKIGGWVGRVTDIHNNGKGIELEWDSEVLTSLTDADFKKLIRLDYQPFHMIVPADDVEPGEPRDNIDRLEFVQDLIEKKFLKLENQKVDQNDFRYYTEKWCRKFIHSQYYPKLTYFQRENLYIIVDCFAEFMYDHYSQLPKNWNAPALEDVCLNIIPHKAALENEIFKSFGTVLQAFFKFLDDRKYVDTTELQRKIKCIKKQIYINALNDENWSHAKRFTMAAIEKGIDLNDTLALNIFGIEYNKNLLKKQKGASKNDDKGFILDYVYSKT